MCLFIYIHTCRYMFIGYITYITYVQKFARVR